MMYHCHAPALSDHENPTEAIGIRILHVATISIFEINNIILTISDYWGTRPGTIEIPVIYNKPA